MVSINSPAPKFRDSNRQPECNLMLSYQSLPQSPILSTSSHRFSALKFASKSAFPHSWSFPVSEAHRRFPTKWKISCFRHEEFLSGSPNPDSGEKILRESEKSEISKPNIEKGNLATNLGEAVGRCTVKSDWETVDCTMDRRDHPSTFRLGSLRKDGEQIINSL